MSIVPGEIITLPGELELTPGRERRALEVVNTGDRPIQVGSHFHFADVNAALVFDRDAAAGFRLDILAGTSVRFEPGASRDVVLVALGGAARVPGLQVRDTQPWDPPPADTAADRKTTAEQGRLRHP